MSTFIVGLTGGIGSGKTAASDYLASLGICVVDADIVAREVVAPGSQGLQKIIAHFGPDFLLADGTLDRAKLRARVFANLDDKKVLEGITHPAIFEKMWADLQAATSPYALLVSPLLVEGAMKSLCQHIVVIDVPQAVQLKRTMARDNNSAEQVQAIMATQADRDARLAQADSVVVNDADLAALQQKLDQVHAHLLQLAASHATV